MHREGNNYILSIRYLQAQNIIIEPVIIVIITSLIHPLWIYLLTFTFDLGAFGNGLSISLTNLLNFLLIILITKFKAHPEAIVPLFTKESFMDFKEYLNIAIPTLFMICLETWNYEIITLMSGYLPDENQRNAHIILINFSALVYMFPFSLGITSANIVGNYIGGFYPKKAKIAANFILLFTASLSAFFFITFNITRPFLPRIFSSNEKIIEIVNILLIYYFFYQFFDFITTCFCGIYRGLGMQKIIAYTNLVCFYIISLPLNYYLTFPLGLEVYGIRINYIVVIFLLFLVYAYIYMKVDFYEICKVTKKRLTHDQNNIEKSSINNSEMISIAVK